MNRDKCELCGREFNATEEDYYPKKNLQDMCVCPVCVNVKVNERLRYYKVRFMKAFFLWQMAIAAIILMVVITIVRFT